jgi:hypothetical protein
MTGNIQLGKHVEVYLTNPVLLLHVIRFYTDPQQSKQNGHEETL